MVTVLIVDDHDLVRVGVGMVLEGLLPNALSVCEARTLYQAVRIYGEAPERFSLVILDLNLPDTKGLAGLRLFKKHFPLAKVVVLSGSIDESIASEAITLGASAFLHKTHDIARLGDSIIAQLSDRPQEESKVATSGEVDGIQAKRMSLTRREIEILDLVLQGLSNKEIIAATHLQLGTVKNYISSLLTTFGVSSRTRLVSLFH